MKCFYRLPYISLSFLFVTFMLTAFPWNIEKFFNNMNFSAILDSPKFIQKLGTTCPVSLVTKVVCQIQKSGTRTSSGGFSRFFEKNEWKIRKMQFLVTFVKSSYFDNKFRENAESWIRLILQKCFTPMWGM